MEAINVKRRNEPIVNSKGSTASSQKTLTLNKRAITPLIATVLLIAISLAAFALIFMWSRGFVAERIEKFGENIEVVCGRINYEASLVPIEGAGTQFVTVIINNRGNDNIKSVNVKVFKGGKSVVKTLSQTGGQAINAGKIGTINVDLGYFFQGEEVTSKDITRIEVTPVLQGIGKSTQKAKVYVCEDLKQVLKL